MKTTVLEDRAAIAIGWPGKKDGAVVSVGEEKRIEENFPFEPKVRLIYRFLDEFESGNIEELIKKAIEWQREYDAEMIYARNHDPAMRFLESYNRDAYRTKRPFLNVQDPPYSKDQRVGVKGSIEYHIGRLRECLQPGREKLFDLPGTRTKAYLDELDTSETVNIKDRDWPALAALAYCICGLEISKDYERESREAEPDEAYWDD